jgi:Mn-dependent DtxR family transcriptional regulator
MTNEQLKILCLIRAGHVRLQEIANLTHVPKSTVYGRVKALEALGLVSHVAEAAATLRLTEKGRQAIKDVVLVHTGGGIQLGKAERMNVSNINSVTAASSGS